jgi:hypothetical protein
MSDEERVSSSDDEETVDDEGRNPTQRRLDEEGVEDVPVDADWPEEAP